MLGPAPPRATTGEPRKGRNPGLLGFLLRPRPLQRLPCGSAEVWSRSLPDLLLHLRSSPLVSARHVFQHVADSATGACHHGLRHSLQGIEVFSAAGGRGKGAGPQFTAHATTIESYLCVCGGREGTGPTLAWVGSSPLARFWRLHSLASAVLRTVPALRDRIRGCFHGERLSSLSFQGLWRRYTFLLLSGARHSSNACNRLRGESCRLDRAGRRWRGGQGRWVGSAAQPARLGEPPRFWHRQRERLLQA